MKKMEASEIVYEGQPALPGTLRQLRAGSGQPWFPLQGETYSCDLQSHISVLVFLPVGKEVLPKKEIRPPLAGL